MKLLIELSVEIDGELDESRVPDIIMERMNLCQIILSEDVISTEDWVIMINSAEIVKEERG